MNVSAVSGTTQLDAGAMLDQDYGDVEALMKRAHATPEQVRVMLARGTATNPRRRYVVRASGALAAVGAWDCPGTQLALSRRNNLSR